MDGASIIAPSSIDATASRAFRRRAAAGGRLATMAEEGSEEASESGVPSRMSVESPGANEGEEGARRMRTATWTRLTSISSRTRWISRRRPRRAIPPTAPTIHDDDDETATRDDETHARSDSETTTSSKR